MRKMLPILAGFLVMGCSLPKTHDPNLARKPKIPYVDPADRPTLQRELEWEPDSALFAAEGGLALATELLREARRRVAPACVLEIGAGQGAPLVERALGMGWKRALVHQDLVGHDRVLMALA